MSLGQKRKDLKKGLKQSVSFILLFSIGLVLAGCAKVEPEKRAFAQVVSVDYKEDHYQVILGFPNLKEATGQGKEEVSEQEQELPNVYQGETLEKLEGMYEEQENKQLDLGHVHVLLLGDGILENPDAYQYMIRKIEQKNLLCESVYVLKSSQLEDVMKLNGKEIDSLGEYLGDMIEKNKITKLKLEDLYYVWHQQGKIPQIAAVSCLENKKLVVKE